MKKKETYAALQLLNLDPGGPLVDDDPFVRRTNTVRLRQKSVPFISLETSTGLFVHDVRAAKNILDGTPASGARTAIDGLYGGFSILVHADTLLSPRKVWEVYQSDPRVSKAAAICPCGSGQPQELCCE